MVVSSSEDDLLCSPSNRDFSLLTRSYSEYHHIPTYDLAKGEQKHYQQQYGDIYFLRLAKLKPALEELALEEWEGRQIAGDTVHRVPRVLDVRQGELCWVIGTVYMDMPLKPNILDDISKDHWIAAPPPRQKYVSANGQDMVMLEDESGRLRLTGEHLQLHMFVTGCIIAVMGTENADGDFEVIDIRLPDLPPQPERWHIEENQGETIQSGKTRERFGGGKVAIVSGLDIAGDSGDPMILDLFQEWLMGEAMTTSTQAQAAGVTRLIIAGDSLHESHLVLEEETDSTGVKKAAKKYGYDSAAYNAAPSTRLDLFLSTLLPSLPITLLPGAADPANVSLPQQPLHPALFPHSRAYSAPPTTPDQSSVSEPGWFHPTTNPAEFTIGGQRFLGTGGQPIDDIFKYVKDDDRLEMMEQTLRWRLVAPTCPDTLWCYPYQMNDPFVLEQCPHVYFVGNQPQFGTSIVVGPAGQKARMIAVPKFSKTGEVVLVDLTTMDVEVVRFEVFQAE